MNRVGEAGFSLIEAILSVATFMLFVTALVGIYLSGTEGVDVAHDHQRASQIAREGAEAVRSIRDDDFANLIDGTYGLQISGGTWQLCTCADDIDEFSRQLTISSIDSDTKEIEVSVNWQATKSREGDYKLVTQLTDWRQPTGVLSGDPVFRVTEYFIDGENTGTSYDLQLDYDLEPNYFVIIQGAEGNDNNGGNYGPDSAYKALAADPFGTGDLANTGQPDEITLVRGSTGSSTSLWRGVVTVVECLQDCSAAGFELVDVARVNHNGATTNGTDTSSAWPDISKVMLVGAANGSGCDTASSSTGTYPSCHVRLWPSGTNTINWSRDGGGGSSLSTATSTVMAIDWGSEWTVQRRNATGTNGGNGADGTNEYNTSTISAVARENTWVWGTGHTSDNGIGDGAEGTLITLGDGVNQNTTESQLAIGQEYTDNKSFEVYALTHPNLEVDYRFKPDGHSGNLTYDQTVDANAASTNRMALIYNGQNGTGGAFPRPLFSARYLNDTTVRADRRRTGQNWPAWIQGINFSAIEAPASDTTPPAAISDLSTASPTTNSVELSWTAPGDDGNTGTAASYDIRYSVSPITEGNWSAATPVSGEPAPTVAGSNQTLTVSGLDPATNYFFAIKTSDEVPNESSISNIAQATTQGSQASNLNVNTSLATVYPCCGNRYVTGWILTNSGATTITVDRMTVSWTGGSGASQIQGIYLSNDWQHGPNSPVAKGTDINISNFSLAPGSSSTYNWLYFTNSMNNSTLSITFTMTDGSTKSFTGIMP